MARIASLLAFELVALCAASAPASAAQRPCHPTRANTIASSRYSVVYVRGFTAYGCLTSRRRPVRLAGRFVDFVDSSIVRSGRGDHYQRIIVVDLRSGRRHHSHEATSLPSDQLLVTDLVLRPTGRVAWIGPDKRAGPSGYAVWAQGSNSAAVAVDAAPGVEPGSLALAGSRLYWTRGQQPQSQPLA